jgi:error-prone DNA polymerase
MGSKRSLEKMAALKDRLYRGMADRGITGEVADQIYDKLVAFANFGFPESHSVSFAYLVYASAWMKVHYPAAFTAGLLDGQPMGFWSPQTIVADARRHDVVVHRPDVNASGAASRLEALEDGPAVRLGLEYVRHIGRDLAQRIAAAQPFADMEDLVRRTGVSSAQLEALATAGALGCFSEVGNDAADRRVALWAAGAIAQAGAGLEAVQPSPPAMPASDARPRTGRLAGLVTGADAPPLPMMTGPEVNRADLWATGVSPDSYPIEFVRPSLDERGVVTAAGLRGVPAGKRVTVAGVVTHRQRPATAQGTIFLNLEDETGLINVICSQGAWTRFRRVARSEPALLIRGTVEKAEGVINLIAEHIEPLRLSTATMKSRDFR